MAVVAVDFTVVAASTAVEGSIAAVLEAAGLMAMVAHTVAAESIMAAASVGGITAAVRIAEASAEVAEL